MPVANPFLPAGGGGTVNLEHEDISSQCNGSQQSFTVSKPYQTGTLQVYWNGLLQLSSDITEVSTYVFSTTFIPTANDNLVVIFIER